MKYTGFGKLKLKAQCLILATSASYRVATPVKTHQFIYQFLNTRNNTTLRYECDLEYSRNNLYISTSFYQDILQGHILAIPYFDALAGLFPYSPHHNWRGQKMHSSAP